MSERSYYLILGVSEDESAAGIRAAYRALAKQHHPDRCGEKGTAAFQAIAEAYRMLSDPGSRREYDDLHGRSREATRAPPRAEPLVPDRARPPPRWRGGALLDDRDSVHPSFGEVHDRFLRNYTGRGVPKGERLESIDLDLVLTRGEAARGGVIHVPVPVFVTCRACGGSGQGWLLPCPVCDRQGILEGERLAPIELPPMTRSGTLFEVPLLGLGIHNFFLRLRVSIEA